MPTLLRKIRKQWPSFQNTNQAYTGNGVRLHAHAIMHVINKQMTRNKSHAINFSF